jgi:hypothetical protein
MLSLRRMINSGREGEGRSVSEHRATGLDISLIVRSHGIGLNFRYDHLPYDLLEPSSHR